MKVNIKETDMDIKKLDIPETISSEFSSSSIETKIPVEMDKNDMFYLNLMTRVSLPYNMNPLFYTIYNPSAHESFQTISYKFYGTIKLWWLICAANHLYNITEGADNNFPLKIIKKEYVYNVLEEL